MGVVSEAFDGLGLIPARVRQLYENRPELRRDLEELLSRYTTYDRFAGYDSGYRRIKTFEEQLRILHPYFPEYVDPNDMIAPQARIAGAEGCFLMLDRRVLGPSYSEAVKKLFNALNEQHSGQFENRLVDPLDEMHLRQATSKERIFAYLASKESDHPILVLQAQFGLRYRDYAGTEVFGKMTKNEFPLGVYEVGNMLLTHPECLQTEDDPWIDCPGDELYLEGYGSMVMVPYFCVDKGGKLTFGVHLPGLTRSGGNIGLATGFLRHACRS
jgi:hypothetical protein